MDLKLIEPTIKWDNGIQAFKAEMLQADSSMDGCGRLRSLATTQEWLEDIALYKSEATCPMGFVPMTQWITVRESDNKVVGMIQFRHYLNEFLEKYGGNIGYSICPSERGKGYGTEQLALCLAKIKANGTARVLISCLEGNEASRKIITGNGGVYENTVVWQERNAHLERYWVQV